MYINNVINLNKYVFSENILMIEFLKQFHNK